MLRSDPQPQGPARAIAHVGLSIPDIDAAITWYENVFGFELMSGPADLDATKGDWLAEICHEFFGPDIRHLKVAHLATANGTTLELFEFIDPPYRAPASNFEPWRGGIYHFCVVARDIEAQAERIETSGGKRRTSIRTMFEGLPYKACYCEDPWGTIIELFSHSNERAFSNHTQH